MFYHKNRSIVTALLALVFSIMFWAAPAFAQEKFTVAGGSGALSTYSSMLGTMAKFCSTDEMEIEERSSNGSIENLAMLRGGKVKAAMIQSDMILAAQRENASSVATLQTLVALHPEEIHLIARADTKTEGGFNVAGRNFGGDKITFNKAEDLSGRAVGAVGGSVVSANIVNDMLKLGWIVKPYPSTKELLAALTSKTVDAGVIVAGAPSDAVKNLSGTAFKLLPLRGNSDTAAVYASTKVQYDTLNSGRAVDTLSAQALLISRTFRSPEIVATLAKFRACVQSSLDKIKDADGVHPAWQNVEADSRGKWQWYDLPKQGAAVAPTPKAKK